MKVLAVVMNETAVGAILGHLSIDPEAPRIAEARPPQIEWDAA